MLKWLWRSVVALMLTASVALNLFTLTSASVYGAASAALGALGITASSRAVLTSEVGQLQTQLAREKAASRALDKQLQAQRQAARRMGQRVTRRTARIAATQLAELPLKALPVVGVAALVGGTAWEIAELCATLDDMDQLYAELDMDERTDQAIIERVCRAELPAI